MKIKKLSLCVMGASILAATLLCGCNVQDAPSQNETKSDVYLDEKVFSSWIVYWDTKNTMVEVEKLKDQMTGLSWFAANFDSEEKLMIPDALLEFKDETKAAFPEWESEDYLTVVNDKLLEDGTYSLKDTDVLRRIFSDGSLMQAHADELIGLAKKHGFNGIELDYEAIREDIMLWESYLGFCELLQERAQEEGIKLRVLLEPSAPTQSLEFPRGPEYVMMCYNLYGPGLEEGPKADVDFIEAMIDKMKGLPGKKSFALATGGYDWPEGETGRSIVEQEAFFIRTDKNMYVRRYDSSYALRYQYYDDDEILHTVWYADVHTIAHWMEIIEKKGMQNAEEYGLMLWRLGGNILP